MIDFKKHGFTPTFIVFATMKSSRELWYQILLNLFPQYSTIYQYSKNKYDFYFKWSNLQLDWVVYMKTGSVNFHLMYSSFYSKRVRLVFVKSLFYVYNFIFDDICCNILLIFVRATIACFFENCLKQYRLMIDW